MFIAFLAISKSNEAHASIPFNQPSSLVNDDLNYDGKTENILLDSNSLSVRKASDSDTNLNEWKYLTKDNFFNYLGQVVSVGDLDLDASKEIIFTSFKYSDLYTGNVRVHAVDANGKDKPGWSVDFNGYQNTNYYAVIADLNGDLKNEVILIINTSELGTSSDKGFRLVALNSNGTLYFDKVFPGRNATSLSYGNALISNAQDEIVVSSFGLESDSSKITYINNLGEIISEVSIPSAHYPDRITIADIHGDANKELIYETSIYPIQLVVLGTDGKNIPGFPKSYPNEDIENYALGDIDNDSKAELIVGTIDNSDHVRKV